MTSVEPAICYHKTPGYYTDLVSTLIANVHCPFFKGRIVGVIGESFIAGGVQLGVRRCIVNDRRFDVQKIKIELSQQNYKIVDWVYFHKNKATINKYLLTINKAYLNINKASKLFEMQQKNR